MRYWFLIFPVLFILIQAQHYSFDEDKDAFSKCIETHLSHENLNLKTIDGTKNIADMAAQRFSGKSLLRHKFHKGMNTFFYELKNRKSSWFRDDLVPEHLRLTLREVLKSCMEIISQQHDLPRFDNEPSQLAEFLDYVLVDWSKSLNDMIHSQNGRSILRRYAYAAGARLMSALRYFSMDYDRFRRQLRETWMLRAQQYFDGRSTQYPYIRHRFSINEDIQTGIVYTVDNPDLWIHRRTWDFTERNPVIQHENFHRILKVHSMGIYRYEGVRDRIFFEYQLSGSMTSAQYYLESHIDQCYRIIFFILELQAEGISSDEDDVYDGSIPNQIFHTEYQQIVDSDETYRLYLIFLRERLEKFSNEEFEQCLSNDGEEYLIILFVQWIVKTTHNFSTTTTSSTPTTSYEKVSKKGGVRLKECGKYFLTNKRLKTMFYEREQKKVKRKGETYGYVLQYEDDNHDSNEISNMNYLENGFTHSKLDQLCKQNHTST